MRWMMTCEANHEPETWYVEADTQDLAYEEFMKMPECIKHSEEKHADMPEMSAEDMKKMIMPSIKPAEEAAAAPVM